jgi:hypothetical protein
LINGVFDVLVLASAFLNAFLVTGLLSNSSTASLSWQAIIY